MTSSWDQSSLTLYRAGEFFRIDTAHDELDAQAVERFAPRGRHLHAVRRGGDRRRSTTARPTPRSSSVRRRSRRWPRSRERGETMPQKSTYFFPKLTSGLLLHPL